MALRDILQRHPSAVALGAIAEIERPQSIAKGDAHDPRATSVARLRDAHGRPTLSALER